MSESPAKLTKSNYHNILQDNFCGGV